MSEIIYDWNSQGPTWGPVELHDETLRDGIQCPSVKDPTISEKREILRRLDHLGIASADIGLPGAGQRAIDDVTELVEMVRDEGRQIRLCAAGRTLANDIKPIIAISEKTGVPLEVMAFLGSSPIRMLTEDWDEAKLESLTRSAMKMSSEAGLPTSFVTEDTIRSKPEVLRRLFDAAIEEGADRLVLCDTVGHATPTGTRNLIAWTIDYLNKQGLREKVRVDWHGHSDRGLGLINALVAIDAGCDRVHGTILGIGERIGNTNLDLLLVNMRLSGVVVPNLHGLTELVTMVSEACEMPIPINYPVFGLDAFRTGTGVHAAAVIKAENTGDSLLADQIYSGVPASWFGREQEICVGHQSGISNVRYWLKKNGYEATDKRVSAIFSAAKQYSRLMTNTELHTVAKKV